MCFVVFFLRCIPLGFCLAGLCPDDSPNTQKAGETRTVLPLLKSHLLTPVGDRDGFKVSLGMVKYLKPSNDGRDRGSIAEDEFLMQSAKAWISENFCVQGPPVSLKFSVRHTANDEDTEPAQEQIVRCQMMYDGLELPFGASIVFSNKEVSRCTSDLQRVTVEGEVKISVTADQVLQVVAASIEDDAQSAAFVDSYSDSKPKLCYFPFPPKDFSLEEGLILSPAWLLRRNATEIHVEAFTGRVFPGR